MLREAVGLPIIWLAFAACFGEVRIAYGHRTDQGHRVARATGGSRSRCSVGRGPLHLRSSRRADGWADSASEDEQQNSGDRER